MKYVITVYDIFDKEKIETRTGCCDIKDLVPNLISVIHKLIEIHGKDFTFTLHSSRGEMCGLLTEMRIPQQVLTEFSK